MLLAVTAALAVSSALVWGNPAATAQQAAPDHEIEARIGARWHADGRVEFGLQVRADTGAWGEGSGQQQPDLAGGGHQRAGRVP